MKLGNTMLIHNKVSLAAENDDIENLQNGISNSVSSILNQRII